MSLSPIEKELVAVSGSVAAGCKPCTSYHCKAARATGANDQQLRQAIAIATNARLTGMRILEDYALTCIGEDAGAAAFPHSEIDRLSILMAIGAAFAVNCVTSLKYHLKSADNADISTHDIAQATELAAFIKTKACSHVERLTGTSDENIDSAIG